MPVLSAAEDYRLFTTSINREDPVRMVGQVMLGLSNGQAQILRQMTADVTALTDQMAQINDLLNKLNNAKSTLGATDQTSDAVVFVSRPYQSVNGTIPEINNAIAATHDVLDQVMAIIGYGGADPKGYVLPGNYYPAVTTPNAGNYGIGPFTIKARAIQPPVAGTVEMVAVANRPELDSMSQNLQRAIDQISSKVQQAQTDLQTMMGRYNGSFEVVTSTIKKSETQAQSVTANVRK
ncbi:MAG: hypothetical protein EOO28_16350 [Comamonadaceae bacterium]|nr:MAG: hypothetical protein EOO28_16350 [Comamonadaceae bacterium]